MKYKVQVPKSSNKFLAKKNIKNIDIKENNYTFDADQKSVELLRQEINDIIVINKRKRKLKIFFRKYLISLLGLFLITIFVINQSFTIKKILFIKENTYDIKVEEKINQYITKIGPFKYLNANIVDINFELHKEFYYYEWISIEKRGTKLLVNIEKQDQRSYINEESNVLGDIIAKKDGVIYSMYVKKGIIVAKDGQTVLQNQLLVSGNLKYGTEEIDYIHPVAVVLATVIDYENISVEKESLENKLTGKIEVKYGYSFFNKLFMKSSKFENYIVKSSIIYDGKFFQKVKFAYYETNDILVKYDYDEALEYAKSLIKKKLMENKVNENEKIVYIDLISCLESTEKYSFKFVVKKIENIASFVAVKLENKES